MRALTLSIIRTVLISILGFLAINASAQTIMGKVHDENDLPLAYANVMLQKVDSTYISGAMTDTLGMFALKADPQAAMIQVSFIGYEPYYAPISGMDFGIIRLVPDTELLEKSIVKGYLPKTVIKGDAFVTPIENSVLAESGSANDVLGKLPGVISKDGGYEVIGKGSPIIYINGRLLRDNSELGQISSKEIRSVEVIHNPGARYDATVKAVIRIQTVKRVGDGFGFDIMSNWGQSEYTSLNETVNMNYRHNGLDIFASVAYSDAEGFQETTLDQTLMTTHKLHTEQDAFIFYRSKALTPTLGMNWQISPLHSVGIRYRPSMGLLADTSHESDTFAFLDNEKDDETNTVSNGHTGFAPTHEVNMYYNGTAGKLGIDFNADFHDSRMNDDKTYNETDLDQEERTLNTVSNTHNRLYASKLTLTYPIFRGILTAGSEYSNTMRDDRYVSSESYVPSTYTTIRENEFSAFAEYMFPLKFGSLSAGVRYEHIGFGYYENEVKQDDQSRKYDNFYPNASFAAMAGPFQFLLSYSSKTTRPHYSYLSNSLFYIDRYSMQQGNPLLRPEMNHDISFAAVWKFVQVGVSYQVIRNAILHNATSLPGNDSAILIYYDNFDRNIPTMQAMVAITPTIGIWYPRLSVALVKQWLTVDSMGEEISLNKPLPVIQFGNSLRLPKGFILNVDYNFQGKGDHRVYHMTKSSNELNASLRKSFLKNALTIDIYANDLLDDRDQSMTMFSKQYSLEQWSRQSMRTYGITLRYSFNTTQSKYKGTGAGTAQKDRMK